MMDQHVPLLLFDHITFGYQPNSKKVLHSLSLEIEPGTVTAILGPNGAGKTTLLHLALGWLTPQSGQVQLDGRSLGSYSRRKLGQWMALVPQSERIPFDYSILEYVLLGRAPYLAPLDIPGAQDCQISERVIEQVGLGCLNGRAVTTLSGGERQLALVARALAQQPRLLLLDEPTSHLDLANKARLIKLMQELAARGVTLLLTTHEPDAAAAIATHLVLMRDGQVYQTGPLSQVFTAEHLSATYNVPVSVAQVDGRRIALWT
jgi:iron complex transport system ATP-binding protein